MLLERLSVKNFRQFYGEQSVEFATGERNVTVIYGSNGAGKSTLLNAFLWLFYDEIELSHPERIASERAMAETEVDTAVEVTVELEFKHEGKRYQALRTAEFTKKGENDLVGVRRDVDLVVRYTDADGNWKARSNPQNSLEQILPKRLRDVFFFDGETIDELTEMGSQDRVQAAIRNVMGLEILERAIRHLDHVEGEFEDEVERHGSEELSELIQEKREIDAELGQLDEKLDNAQASLERTDSEIQDVDDRLRELEESRDLQEERDALKEERERIEAGIGEVNTDLREVISESGYLVFGLSALEETAEMLREKRKKGEIPTRIKTTFVEDLLELEECICDRHLREGSDPREAVKEWRTQAGSTELEERAMTIVGRLSEIGDEQNALFDSVQEFLEKRAELKDRLETVNGTLDDISTKLTEEEQEDVARLEERRRELEGKRDDFQQQIGKYEGLKEELEEELDGLETDISKAREQNEKAETARRRQLTARYLREKLERLFERYQHEVRESINDRVNDIFQDIIAKDYYAKIDDDYSMLVLKDVGTQQEVSVAKSTGERQVASLSFIASLVSLAKERYESDDESMHFKGGIYPVLMDSPFGYLDPDYQQKVSAMMPKMAEQVVVLVTQSQWSEAVESELDRVAGRKFHLDYYNPQEDRSIPYEYTQIKTEEPKAEVRT